MDLNSKLPDGIRNLFSGTSPASSDSISTVAIDVQHWKQRRAGRIFGLAWLFYLVNPVLDLVRGNQSSGRTIFDATNLALFVAIYLFAYFRNFYQPAAVWRAWIPVVLLALITTVVTLDVNQSWIGLMIYVATVAGCSLSAQSAVRAMVGLAAYTVVLSVVSGASVSATAPLTVEVMLIGVTMLFLRRLIATNAELRIAREESARLAVADERLRFARDLHDLLGHSLSLIALKSELAGRLIEVSPERAHAEIRDIEQVTRDALREVREAVSGYRQPDLNSELDGARAALEAAAIECQIDNRIATPTPTVEAALGWAVREGVTNVIIHQSGASNCRIELHESPDAARLTIVDNGVGAGQAKARRDERAGTGIAGLTERITALGGRVEAGLYAGGGFRLMVEIPVTETPPKSPSLVSTNANSVGRLAWRGQP